MKHDPTIEAVIPLPPFLALAIGAEAVPRSAVEHFIEQMIAVLDEIDGDADLEDAADDEREEGYLPRICGVDQRMTTLETPGPEGASYYG